MQLIVWVCSLLFLALPSFSAASPLKTQPEKTYITIPDDISYAFTAGEVTSGEPEAVLQLDKVHLAKVIHALLLPVYTKKYISPIIPAFYTFSKRNCGHNSMLTKGP